MQTAHRRKRTARHKVTRAQHHVCGLSRLGCTRVPDQHPAVPLIGNIDWASSTANLRVRPASTHPERPASIAANFGRSSCPNTTSGACWFVVGMLFQINTRLLVTNPTTNKAIFYKHEHREGHSSQAMLRLS